MLYVDIFNNGALLLILGILQSFIQHQWIRDSFWGQVVRGGVFGVVAVAAMLNPFTFSPGVIFDGRSVILSIGGLFGGPIVAAIAATIATVYRIFLGGGGMLTGVGSIVIATVGGIFYRHYIKANIKALKFWKLLLFGLCIHTILMIWFVTLPDGIFFQVLREIAIAFLTIFPIATAILGSVIFNQELRFIAEEQSRINAQKYRTLLETAPDIILTLDPQGIIYFINHIPEWFKGSSIATANIYDFLKMDHGEQFKSMLLEVFNTAQNQFGQFLLTSPEGKKIWYAVSLGYMEDEEHEKRAIMVASDISQQMDDYHTIQQRNKEIETLYEINQLIGSSLDLEKIYDSFYRRISEIMECDSMMISSFNPVQKLIHCEYCCLEDKKIPISDFPALPLEKKGKGLQSQVIHSGKAIIINDAQTQASRAEHAYNFDENGNLYKLGEIPEKEENFANSGILVPIVLNNNVVGVIQVYSFQRNAYGEQDLHILQALAAQIAVASNNARLYKELQVSNTQLQQAYDKTLEGWSTALQMREKETAGHTRRVAELTMELADQLGITKEEKVHLWRGALLHDIGKLVLPDEILHKAGALDDDEWVIIKNHPVYAYEWLSPIEYLEPALVVPYYHHEHWDGSGYPKGLKGEQIPLFARLFAIVDVYDALSSDRPYRKAWPQQKVLDYLREQAGGHFDPEIVEVFLKLMKP
ncbi:MAG: HD domain-containing protein [Chloroflexi bacterium]|nr:HD domain-containing protein [Chloroflexota bacterium]